MTTQRATTTSRTLSIIEHIATAENPPTQAQVGQELGLAKSTVSVLLANLRALGYVEHVDRGYRPGPRLRALSRQIAPGTSAEDELRDALRPILEKVAIGTQETVALTVEIGGTKHTAGAILVVDRIESPRQVRVASPIIGETRPMYPSAAGLVFLAFAGRSASELVPSSVLSLSSREKVEIDAELESVRSRGYAVIDNPYEGLTVVSAPTSGPGFELAAISVYGPSHRVTDPVRTIWPLLKAALEERS